MCVYCILYRYKHVSLYQLYHLCIENTAVWARIGHVPPRTTPSKEVGGVNDFNSVPWDVRKRAGVCRGHRWAMGGPRGRFVHKALYIYTSDVSDVSFAAHVATAFKRYISDTSDT